MAYLVSMVFVCLFLIWFQFCFWFLMLLSVEWRRWATWQDFTFNFHSSQLCGSVVVCVCVCASSLKFPVFESQSHTSYSSGWTTVTKRKIFKPETKSSPSQKQFWISDNWKSPGWLPVSSPFCSGAPTQCIMERVLRKGFVESSEYRLQHIYCSHILKLSKNSNFSLPWMIYLFSNWSWRVAAILKVSYKHNSHWHRFVSFGTTCQLNKYWNKLVSGGTHL